MLKEIQSKQAEEMDTLDFQSFMDVDVNPV